MNNQIALVKEGDGFVCFLQFSLLEKLFGGPLFEIIKRNSTREEVI